MKSFLKSAKSKVTAEPAIVKAVKDATNSEPWGPLGAQMKVRFECLINTITLTAIKTFCNNVLVNGETRPPVCP
jgi:hypothetical protein